MNIIRKLLLKRDRTKLKSQYFQTIIHYSWKVAKLVHQIRILWQKKLQNWNNLTSPPKIEQIHPFKWARHQVKTYHPKNKMNKKVKNQQLAKKKLLT